MNKLMLTLAALIAASACSATAQTRGSDELRFTAATMCSIDVSPTRHGVLFEAFARTDGPAIGEYEFVLTKDDAGGSSDISQSGGFDLAAGEESMLGSSELSLERGGRYRARLVMWDGGEEICRAERRS